MPFYAIRGTGLGALDPKDITASVTDNLPVGITATASTALTVVDSLTSNAASQFLASVGGAASDAIGSVTNPLLGPLTAFGTGLMSDAIGIRQSLGSSIGGLVGGVAGSAIFGPLGGIVGQVFINFLIGGLDEIFSSESAQEKYVRQENARAVNDERRYQAFTEPFRRAYAEWEASGSYEGRAVDARAQQRFRADQRDKWLHAQLAAGNVVYRLGLPQGVVKDCCVGDYCVPCPNQKGYVSWRAVNGKLVEISTAKYDALLRQYHEPNTKVLVLESNFGADQLIRKVNAHEGVLQAQAAYEAKVVATEAARVAQEKVWSAQAEAAREAFWTKGGKLPPYPSTFGSNTRGLKENHQWVRYLVGDDEHQLKVCPENAPMGCWIRDGYAWGQRAFYPEEFEPFGFKLKPLPKPFAPPVIAIKLNAPTRKTAYV